MIFKNPFRFLSDHINPLKWFLLLLVGAFSALVIFYLVNNSLPRNDIPAIIEQKLVKKFKYNKPLQILAVTPQYADICRLIGGKYVQVDAIIKNSTANPHNFILDNQDIQRFQNTDIFILNGLAYDKQIEQAVRSSRQEAHIIIVGALNTTTSSNPHIWFATQTYPKLALKICEELQALLPENSDVFAQNYQNFLKTHRVIDTKVAAIKKKYPRKSAFANEPILNLLLQEMNIDLFDETVQKVCSHGHEPSGAAYITLMKKLKLQRPNFFILNSQANNVLSKIIMQVAAKHKVPVIYIEEILPANLTAIAWLEQTIDAIDRALQTMQQ